MKILAIKINDELNFDIDKYFSPNHASNAIFTIMVQCTNCVRSRSKNRKSRIYSFSRVPGILMCNDFTLYTQSLAVRRENIARHFCARVLSHWLAYFHASGHVRTSLFFRVIFRRANSRWIRSFFYRDFLIALADIEVKIKATISKRFSARTVYLNICLSYVQSYTQQIFPVCPRDFLKTIVIVYHDQISATKFQMQNRWIEGAYKLSVTI